MERVVGYATRRLVLVVPVLLGVSVVIFMMIHLAPGDPATTMLGPLATKESITKLRTELGLDDPLWIQYGRWLWNVLRGDLGRSIYLGRPVLPEVIDKFKNSLILASASLVLAVGGGITLGVIAAVRRNSWVDRFATLVATGGICIPPFWLGILLVVLFSVKRGWLPASGMHAVDSDGSVGELLQHMILPSIALGATPMATIARMTRSSMLEVLVQDYIRTARAKGQSPTRIIVHHALPNTLINVITVIGLQIGFLLASAVLIEIVFSWPGLGSLIIKGILTRDLPLVQGGVLVIASVYVFVNLTVDVAYALIDPRVLL